ncbi:MAG: hypothetical protein E5V72_01435 [Mesorhizobium sp.]|uniref:hypothetical protein n=1 Tax=Mesorhizobium sp. TaxID=1871066 RepID=UPI000FEA5137|nr:hypothetical protein [Mesorhizobium sp.]RWH52261.1 MAG: hypothetical protein EOQ82_26555 [Mesorhizobium sp.]RWI69706.1 MAG: hypothetical protein EOR18_20980 [Mesorhizobium sp.]RWI76173.1 MAG: hypothetical protein EOR19_18570 [Mesorhizobium sp.]RWJ33243.1 MAG: hypothetical protein EOR28_11700 [Mesorhizobium sp.]TIQ74073.1 MAG: hypothetical protein E5X40_06800 [Mesorhizobium sp.]
MSYSSDLSRRLRHKKPMTGFLSTLSQEQRRQALNFSGDDTHGAPIVPDFEVKVPPHPQKYPDHKGHKGAVFGGICNRTACNREHAEFYNRGTYGYYCADDAIAINRYSGKAPLCIVVDHDLSHEEMDAHYRRMMEEMRP